MDILNKLPLVICHNDLFWENMLQLPSKKKLYSIDYEFGALNHLGSDLVSIVSELLIDYGSDSESFDPSDCPSKEDLHQMIKFFFFLYLNPKVVDSLDDSVEMPQKVLESEAFKSFDSELIEHFLSAFDILYKLLGIFWIWRSLYVLDCSNEDIDHLNWANDVITKEKFTIPL